MPTSVPMQGVTPMHMPMIVEMPAQMPFMQQPVETQPVFDMETPYRCQGNGFYASKVSTTLPVVPITFAATEPPVDAAQPDKITNISAISTAVNLFILSTLSSHAFRANIMGISYRNIALESSLLKKVQNCIFSPLSSYL